MPLFAGFFLMGPADIGGPLSALNRQRHARA